MNLSSAKRLHLVYVILSLPLLSFSLSLSWCKVSPGPRYRHAPTCARSAVGSSASNSGRFRNRPSGRGGAHSTLCTWPDVVPVHV